MTADQVFRGTVAFRGAQWINTLAAVSPYLVDPPSSKYGLRLWRA